MSEDQPKPLKVKPGRATPPPWRVTSQPVDVAKEFIVCTVMKGDHRNGHIAVVASGKKVGDAYADACILAAGPELLAACKALLAYVGDRSAGSAQAWDAAKAAIAKAEGGT